MAMYINGSTKSAIKSLMMSDDKVWINGKEYKKPGRGNACVQCGNDIYINGRKFKNGKFKWSLRGFIECYILF